MKNLYTAIAFLLIVFLSLIPPIDFFFKNPFTDKWFLLILICGFSGFYMAFVKTNLIIKALAIWSFISCFFSVAPFISFTSYVSIIICCYFYVVCTRIENWDTIFKMLQTILFLNVFMMFAQGIGKDTLLNWDSKNIEHFGIVGQNMQMASFGVVLCSILIFFSTMNFVFPFLIALFCNSTWTFLSVGIGASIYFFRNNKKSFYISMAIVLCVFVFSGIRSEKFIQNVLPTGRLQTWKDTIHYANMKPWFGWGPGTYKFVFPQLTERSRHIGQAINLPYKSAHNFIAQLLFEVGYPLTFFILASIAWLIFVLWYLQKTMCLSGLAMIFTDGLVHFPDRMIQTVLLIILFIAFCERQVRDGRVSI